MDSSGMKITGGGEGDLFTTSGPCIFSRSCAKKLVAESLSSRGAFVFVADDGGGGGAIGVCGLLVGVPSSLRLVLQTHKIENSN